MDTDDLHRPPIGEPWAGHAETHISTVFFAGGMAYKQLKPLTLAFLDHATLERRHAALENELILNSRLAPDVYLGVTTVEADGEPVDHLLVMRRMPAARRLASLVDAPDFDDHLRSVARAVATFHASLEPDGHAAAIADVDAERERWEANIAEMRLIEAAPWDDGDLDTIADLSSRFLDHRDLLFVERARSGLARDGHGDLLADDIFCLDDGPRILDCLAFDPELRKGDVLADIAFLVMDIERLAGGRAAQRLLHWYQEFGNEHHPASLAHHYIAYRALVRAKVAGLRHAQGRDADDRRTARNHLAQCLDHLQRARIRVVLVGGGPGTGKSTLAASIGEVMRWPVLSTDELRKERAGLDVTAPALARPDEGLYTPALTAATYEELVDHAARLVAHGEWVVLDASWSKAGHRETARAMAEAGGADIVELECALDPAIAKERIVRRLSSPWTTSDATPEIVDHLATLHDDWPEATAIDTTASPLRCRAEALRVVLGDALAGPSAGGTG